MKKSILFCLSSISLAVVLVTAFFGNHLTNNVMAAEAAHTITFDSSNVIDEGNCSFTIFKENALKSGGDYIITGNRATTSDGSCIIGGDDIFYCYTNGYPDVTIYLGFDLSYVEKIVVLELYGIFMATWDSSQFSTTIKYTSTDINSMFPYIFLSNWRSFRLTSMLLSYTCK